MPRRLLILVSATAALAAIALALAPGPSRPSAATNFSCGDTNAKLQIFVTGPNALETQWAFYITPNPFSPGGTLRVVSDQFPDAGSGRGDILLEDVCTTTTGESYTVSVDPVGALCPLTPASQTKPGPPPTPPGGDPYTVAFYFQTNCPTPTPTATPAPQATPTAAATATPSPTGTPSPTAEVTVVLTPASVPCRGTALVTVTVRLGGEPVEDGSAVAVATSLGALTPATGATAAGSFTALLTLPEISQAGAGTVSAYAMGRQAAAPFSAAACVSDVQTSPPVIRPPSTGDAGLR
jgi:hypothetical protein